MSDKNDNYVPDKRLTQFVNAVDREDEDAKEDLCPSFTQLTQGFDRYRDETLLGRGGLKEVYKTFDGAARQWVALARLRDDRGLRCYDLFVHEAWLIASLSHPNIIKVHDVGADTEGRPFFTMDLKRGTSLDDLIRANHPRTELLVIFQKVCDAVAYAHSQGIIHLDLKPENIQCDRFGEVLVCDWGAARSLQREGEESSTSLLPHKHHEHERLVEQVRGTPGYMAPEQVSKPDGVRDERTDVYALGCILHTILCGEPPFRGSAEEVLKKTANCEVPSLRTSFPERTISASMEAVVLKAVALQPENRYASAIELKQEIQQFLGGFSTNAEDSGFWKETMLFLLRHRIPSLITFVALVVLTLSSILFIQRIGREQVATEEEQLRANQLMLEVDLLSTEYDALFEESSVTQKELAQKLVQSANRVMILGFFKDPERAVNDAWRLVNMALALDSECDAARWKRYSLYCIQLNHQQALTDPLNGRPHFFPGVSRLAEAFPDFDFTKDYRPDADQFKNFLRQACLMEDKHLGHLERVFVFHQAMVAGDQERLVDELTALVQYSNGGPERCTMTYQKESRRLVLSSDSARVQLTTWGEGSGRCILRYLPVRHLELNFSGNFNLKHLRYLDVESIDLSGCENLKLGSELPLPNLRRITIQAGQFSREFLESKIRSTDAFEIIEI